jgi:hypothetical protein
MAACAGAGPVLGMVVFQILFAGLNIFYKLAVSDGMDLRVLIAYRYLFASAFLAPLAYFLERYYWIWIYIYNACMVARSSISSVITLQIKKKWKLS